MFRNPITPAEKSKERWLRSEERAFRNQVKDVIDSVALRSDSDGQGRHGAAVSDRKRFHVYQVDRDG
jgi:hypothetical protein